MGFGEPLDWGVQPLESRLAYSNSKGHEVLYSGSFQTLPYPHLHLTIHLNLL